MLTFAQKSKATQQTASAKSTTPSRPFLGQSRRLHANIHGQRMIGNQAVLGLPRTEAENIDRSPAASVSTGFSQDFSRIPVHASAYTNIQPKLKVNAPGDKYEQEADRVAEQVMRMPTPAGNGSGVRTFPSRASGAGGLLQSAAATAPDDEAIVQRETAPEDDLVASDSEPVMRLKSLRTTSSWSRRKPQGGTGWE